MTAGELLEVLRDLDPDTEVRLMTQPSWPFEYSVSGTWQPATPDDTCSACGAIVGDHDDDTDHEPEGYFEPAGDPTGVVYLLEGTQLAYGTSDAWQR